MADIFDPRGDYHYKLIVPMLCAGTCTKDYVVSANSSGDVTNSATATLSAAVGVAQKAGVAGDVIPVQIGGYCKFTSDGNVANTDLVLHVINGGTVSGATEAELSTDPTIGFAIVAKNLLAADAGTVVYGWLMNSAGM
jgi:hypothetical protein